VKVPTGALGLRLLAGIALISLVVNAYLLWDRAERIQAEREATGVADGSLIESVVVLGPTGDEMSIPFAQSDLPTVLYVIAPDCVWCDRNAPVVRELVMATVGRFRFVGLSIKRLGLAEHLERTSMPFPVYVPASDQVFRTLKVRAVPTTIILAPEGRVIATVTGAFVGENRGKIEHFTSTTLRSRIDESDAATRRPEAQPSESR
jgi:thiol-disulfide isomerase/thioredoxin